MNRVGSAQLLAFTLLGLFACSEEEGETISACPAGEHQECQKIGQRTSCECLSNDPEPDSSSSGGSSGSGGTSNIDAALD